MSKQSDQRYHKELGKELGTLHKERAKDKSTSNSVKDMASREGYGDGNPYGFSDKSENKKNR